MQLVDRIEKRRFVGREFLLWVWFESEIFEGTLSTKEHGSFGLWIERQIVLSSGKAEVTRIRGAQPATSREAKEALRLGKLPELAGLHLSWREQEATFVLRAEQLALSGLSLPTVLGGAEEDAAPAALEPARPPRRRARGKEDAARAAERESDEAHESFYERMRLTRDVESIVEAIYRDFLALRLGPAWGNAVAPALRLWAEGGEVDVDRYRAARSATGGDAVRAAARPDGRRPAHAARSPAR